MSDRALETLSPDERLDIVAAHGLWQVVRDHLGGDWSRRQEVVDGISRETFFAWADRQPLPSGRIHDSAGTFDGIYVLPDGDGWRVFEQERGGVSWGSETRWPSFEAARRQAFALVVWFR